MPGSVELMQRAYDSDWYIALASRARRIRLHRTLAVIHFPLQFDAILGTEDIVDPSTDRKNHARAGQLFGIDAAHCVVIEDSLSGIMDACAAGIGRVIGLTSSFDQAALLAAGAHEVVDQLDAVRIG
jgi:sugar-phosphatase